jgi:hypothetical protein
MPAVFWGEAVVTAVYFLNRSPTKALNDRTRYEAWHERKPTVSHLWVFDYLTFAKELGHMGKLDDRSTLRVFIGYTEGLKAYHILDPRIQRVRTACDIVFNKGRGWAWDKVVDNGSTLTYDNFTVEYIHVEGAGGVGSSLPLSMSTLVPEPPPTSAPHSPVMTSAAMRSSPPRTPASMATPLGTSTTTPAHVEHNLVEFTTPFSHDDGEPSQRLDGAGTGPSRSGGVVASCV